jgi:hypothetical protein
MVGEGAQDVVPELVEPVPQRRQPVAVDPVDVAGAADVVVDQPSLSEHLEVLRDRRPADRHVVGQPGDRTRPAAQRGEDRPPGGVTQRVQY